MNIRINGNVHFINTDNFDDTSLLNLLIDLGYSIPHPCMGGGKCGKCKVSLKDPSMQSITPEENKHLSDYERTNNYRLACCLKPINQMSVELLDNISRQESILSSGFLPDVQFQPNVKIESFNLNIFNDQCVNPIAEAIRVQFPNMVLNLSALSSFNANESYHSAICINNEIVEFCYGENNQSLYGLAIDIGTTTIVLTLVDLNSSKILKSISDINPQTTYGLDVLSRITYVMTDESSRILELQQLLVRKINLMVETICNELEIDSRLIYEAIIAANPTMTHLLLGLSPKTIGRSPYVPIVNESQTLSVKKIGIKGINKEAQLTTLPIVSAYVGSDVVAATLIAQHISKETFLLIDIGTNGEIVLHHKGEFVSCSCAAGPAMEGMNISSGMRASSGAIENITITPDGIDLEVIGESKPVGLCGSGVLATVREVLANNLINARGRIISPDNIDQPSMKKLIGEDENGKRWINLTNNIRFTQEDVRQIQLAKGSILAAIYTILESRGVEINQVKKVIVSGQFGAHVKENSLIGVGIIPKAFSGKVEYIGNASLSGAYLSLINSNLRQEMINMAETIEYIELSLSKAYERRFAKCAQFKF